MTSFTNQRWLLRKRPKGHVKESDFEWNSEELTPPKEGEFIVRTIYLSLDPANRGWMDDRESYVEPVQLGTVMRGLGLGVVETSQNAQFKAGDLVHGLLGWQTYVKTTGEGLTVLPRSNDIPLSAYLGLFGLPGLTAYFGLLDVGQPREDETLVISGAAGSVGSLVGQIGKIKGCRVVGIAGTDEKCQWITQTLGFDGAINYKTEAVSDRLAELCPNGVDVFFDNVGGSILDAVLVRINKNARIVICGMISVYNATEQPTGPSNLVNLLIKRARMEGFIVMDYYKRNMEAITSLMNWYRQGKLTYRVDVVEGLEQAPTALNRLFNGTHQGKLMLRVSPEP